MKSKNNMAVIGGRVLTEPKVFDCCGETFYEFDVSVKRESGTEDIIPVNVSEILAGKVCVGNTICLGGQIRTYNKQVDGKSRLIVVFFALDKYSYEGDVNSVELTGYFCKQPQHRITPLGRDICDVLLAVNRDRGKSDYIPLIVWGRTARHIGTLDVGQHTTVTGRFQSRVYQKAAPDGKVIERTAYEVSVNRITETEAEE